MQHFRFATMTVLLLAAGLTQAEVRVQGPVEAGVFISQHRDFQPGERVLTQANQQIEQTTVVPAKLGTKFGMRYTLTGKTVDGEPLTLLYLTPGVVGADGRRHDKFVVTQKLVPDASRDVMAFEFSENHEVVPGEWHFLLFQGDRKLAEQRFEVR
ncbi:MULTISPECIES: DUF3859 domain-containing protein [unclassified Pseudomonas]|uniref:DUF3859 domain-containing protein n=1 Tax=unclassified Pseudomonas TaxID=196821 RepID=UPI000968D520|nr:MULTISPECIES: DUF3859 domain-containing protein [unclassified Pseudomonas]OLU16728.1 helicase [Pseudomonas sp. PA1(2017)]OLU35906.1 helicase [Pseudomonas sp. PA27(2017)]